MQKTSNFTVALIASVVASQAQANLVLDQGVTGSFGGVTSTGTTGNDFALAPSSLFFGQLRAQASGTANFYYIGNEAGYTNSLMLNYQTPAADVSDSTAGDPDSFTSLAFVGSVNAVAGQLLDFGFCTDGGDDTGAWDRCVWNNQTASLTEQFNYGGVGGGYRSIGYRAVTNVGTWAGDTGPYQLWGVFWDDSGAKNDDNHDDYIAFVEYRTAVPEPATMLLFGVGALGMALTRRRSRAALNAGQRLATSV